MNDTILQSKGTRGKDFSLTPCSYISCDVARPPNSCEFLSYFKVTWHRNTMNVNIIFASISWLSDNHNLSWKLLNIIMTFTFCQEKTDYEKIVSLNLARKFLNISKEGYQPALSCLYICWTKFPDFRQILAFYMHQSQCNLKNKQMISNFSGNKLSISDWQRAGGM